MKKLLVLVLVLGMASLANAAMSLRISVHSPGGGETWDVNNPEESEIWLAPSEYLYLDLWTTADITPGSHEGFWALTCQTTDASISGGTTQSPYKEDAVIFDDAVYYGVPLPEGENGPWGMIALVVVSEIPAGTRIYDEIDFHCEWVPPEGFNDVVITLWETDFSTSWYMDSVIIHQIPEPATLALLGLGSLFLLRRRK